MATDAEKLAALIAAARRLRAAQECFFQVRTPTALQDAKDAERAFDATLKSVTTPDAVVQPSLF